jgi:hypothetical protein
LPFGVSLATTWLNLMTIGACAMAAPEARKTAVAAAARINLTMRFPPKIRGILVLGLCGFY